MSTRTDTDLLAHYGITEPPVGSVWTWHTPQGHRVTAVATHSPTDRLGRAGGIPAVGSRQLEDHPANAGILAGIFREHVCPAYAMLVFDPDGTAPARWTVCDGKGRTTDPALTEFGAWRVALESNANPDLNGEWGGPWVSGVSLEHNLAAIGRYNADRWKAEAERLLSLRANVCRDLGLDPNDNNADIAGAIEALKERTVERIMEKAGPIQVAPMPVPDDIDRDEAGYHSVDGVPLTDIIDARTHLLGLLGLEWDASADDVAAGAARLSRILRGPVADAEAEARDARHATMRAESQADVLRAALVGLLGEFRAVNGDDVPDLVQAAVQFRKRMVGALDAILTRIDGESTEDVGMTVMRVQDCADEMERCIKDGELVEGLSNTITTLEQRLTVMEAERDHLAAWHRGPDPVAMAALWEHDPAHATELLHPVFRLVSLFLWTGSERAKSAEHLFPSMTDARSASEPGAAVVRLIDGRAVVRLDVDGTDHGLWAVGDWVRDSLRTALTMHPGVWALLGATGPVDADLIRLEDVVPF